jgi:hypothetical protein
MASLLLPNYAANVSPHHTEAGVIIDFSLRKSIAEISTSIIASVRLVPARGVDPADAAGAALLVDDAAGLLVLLLPAAVGTVEVAHIGDGIAVREDDGAVRAVLGVLLADRVKLCLGGVKVVTADEVGVAARRLGTRQGRRSVLTSRDIDVCLTVFSGGSRVEAADERRFGGCFAGLVEVHGVYAVGKAFWDDESVTAGHNEQQARYV